jgi:hypothetical protein
MKGLLDYMLWNNVFPSDALVLIPPLSSHPCDLLSILNNVLLFHRMSNENLEAAQVASQEN